MRPPLRSHGRYAATSGMSVVKGAPGDPFALVVVDRRGLPVPEATIWYHLRRQPGPNRTRDTYLGYLLPVLAFFRDQGWDWAAPPEQVRHGLLAFQCECLHLLISPDRLLEGYRVQPTAQTPLSESGLRCLHAAVRSFYETLREADLYPFANPMTSFVLTGLKRARAKLVENAGAPDHAGIRSLSHAASSREPTAFFRARQREDWAPDRRLLMPDVLRGLRAALDHMLDQPRNALADRERAVLLLLRFTGARVTEVLGLTVGGYRSHTADGIAYQALVVNKGSQGREVKVLDWAGAPLVQTALRHYLSHERPQADVQGRSCLRDLGADDPFFLARSGQPYSYLAFRWHWRQLYPAASRLCPVPFRIHDIRHLFVTEWLLRARHLWGAASPQYADTRQTITRVMGWRSASTIDAYDHSLNEVEALGLLHSLQGDIAQRVYGVVPATVEVAGGAVSAAVPASDTLSPTDLAWVTAHTAAHP